MLQTAFQNAVHKKGVAVLGLPGDITNLPAADAETTTMLFRNSPVVRPSESELVQLAELLNAHKNVTLFCRLGAAEAHDELIQLAEKLKAPIAYTYKGKIAIQYDNPYEVVITGLLEIPAAYQAMHECEIQFVAAVINELADKDAIFTVDTGMCCVWAARYIDATGERKMLGSFNHGSMANAMPQAIGAALACLDKQAIAFCGDGGISMSMGDLMTIVQYKLPVKIVIFNYRFIEYGETGNGSSRFS